MITITNVSPEGTPTTGINQYELHINEKLITTFEHDRTYMGLAQCLTDAAEAVSHSQMEAILEMLVATGLAVEITEPKQKTEMKLVHDADNLPTESPQE